MSPTTCSISSSSSASHLSPVPCSNVSIICFAIKLQGTLLKRGINSGLLTWRWCLGASMRYELPWVTVSGEEATVSSRNKLILQHFTFSGLKIRNVQTVQNESLICLRGILHLWTSQQANHGPAFHSVFNVAYCYTAVSQLLRGVLCQRDNPQV